MNKTKIGWLAAFAATLLAVFGATQQTAVQSTALAQESKPSQKQKEHSTLYKQYRREKNLRDLAAEAKSDFSIVEGVGQKVFNPDAPRLNSQSRLNSLACKADAVVVGIVDGKSSQLTEEKNFIFTDYELLVEEVLKDNPQAPIRPNAHLSITRPGGTVQINGLNVSALDEAYLPLGVGGRYLLFLRYLPSTGAYKAPDSLSSFQLKNGRFTKLTKESLPSGLEAGNDPAAFLNNVRQIASGTCNK